MDIGATMGSVMDRGELSRGPCVRESAHIDIDIDTQGLDWTATPGALAAGSAAASRVGFIGKSGRMRRFRGQCYGPGSKVCLALYYGELFSDSFLGDHNRLLR